MTPPPESRPESLLSEQDWVRPLVQRLVRDEARAEDVLQATWLRALHRPPRAEAGGPSWRGWLARVARNLALRDAARESSRRRREERAARGERLPATAEIVEREEQRRRIVEHVLALAEPYRTTLILRFYEGLEPREIAREQRTNASTVRNRIARGLELLRQRLERERGGEWISSCLAALPLAEAQALVTQAGVAGWVLKGWIVAKKVQIAAAAALVLAAGAVWLAWPSKGGDEGVGAARKDATAPSRDSGGLAPPRAPAPEQPTLEGADSAQVANGGSQRTAAIDPATTAVASGLVRVFGSVRDARGRPIEAGGGTIQLSFGSVERLEGAVQAKAVSDRARTALKSAVLLHVDAPRAEPAKDALARQEQRQTAEKALDASQEEQKLRVLSDLSESLTSFTFIGSTTIVFSDSEGQQITAHTTLESEYSVEGLHPGKWRALVTRDGKLARRLEFDLQSGEQLHRLDITLDDAIEIRVRMHTPDGRDLAEAVAADPELSFRVALSPIALRPGSAARFLPEGENQPYGCGRYVPRAQLDEKKRTEIGDASGVLTVTEAPPLEVGIVASGQLVARQPLSPGDEQADFTISLDDLRRSFTTVVAHVVDAQTHAPIPGATMVIFGVRTLSQPVPLPPDGNADDAMRNALLEKIRSDAANMPRADATGELRIPWVQAGRHRFHAIGPDHAALSGVVDVEGGSPTFTLKPIELTGVVHISGRLLDAQGKPAQTQFQLVPVDRFEESCESLANWPSGEDGAFDVGWLRRERYVLRVTQGEELCAPVIIDATQGDVRDLEVHLAATVAVKISLTREPREGAQLRVRTPAGLPVCEIDLAGFAPAQLQLVPGSYVAELREGRRRSASSRFAVQKEAVSVVLVPE